MTRVPSRSVSSTRLGSGMLFSSRFGRFSSGVVPPVGLREAAVPSGRGDGSISFWVSSSERSSRRSRSLSSLFIFTYYLHVRHCEDDLVFVRSNLHMRLRLLRREDHPPRNDDVTSACLTLINSTYLFVELHRSDCGLPPPRSRHHRQCAAGLWFPQWSTRHEWYRR